MTKSKTMKTLKLIHSTSQIAKTSGPFLRDIYFEIIMNSDIKRSYHDLFLRVSKDPECQEDID